MNLLGIPILTLHTNTVCSTLASSPPYSLNGIPPGRIYFPNIFQFVRLWLVLGTKKDLPLLLELTPLKHHWGLLVSFTIGQNEQSNQFQLSGVYFTRFIYNMCLLRKLIMSKGNPETREFRFSFLFMTQNKKFLLFEKHQYVQNYLFYLIPSVLEKLKKQWTRDSPKCVSGNISTVNDNK